MPGLGRRRAGGGPCTAAILQRLLPDFYCLQVFWSSLQHACPALHSRSPPAPQLCTPPHSRLPPLPPPAKLTALLLAAAESGALLSGTLICLHSLLAADEAGSGAPAVTGPPGGGINSTSGSSIANRPVLKGYLSTDVASRLLDLAARLFSKPADQLAAAVADPGQCETLRAAAQLAALRLVHLSQQDEVESALERGQADGGGVQQAVTSLLALPALLAGRAGRQQAELLLALLHLQATLTTSTYTSAFQQQEAAPRLLRELAHHLGGPGGALLLLCQLAGEVAEAEADTEEASGSQRGAAEGGGEQQPVVAGSSNHSTAAGTAGTVDGTSSSSNSGGSTAAGSSGGSNGSTPAGGSGGGAGTAAGGSGSGGITAAGGSGTGGGSTAAGGSAAAGGSFGALCWGPLAGAWGSLLREWMEACHLLTSLGGWQEVQHDAGSFVAVCRASEALLQLARLMPQQPASEAGATLLAGGAGPGAGAGAGAGSGRRTAAQELAAAGGSVAVWGRPRSRHTVSLRLSQVAPRLALRMLLPKAPPATAIAGAAAFATLVSGSRFIHFLAPHFQQPDDDLDSNSGRGGSGGRRSGGRGGDGGSSGGGRPGAEPEAAFVVYRALSNSTYVTVEASRLTVELSKRLMEALPAGSAEHRALQRWVSWKGRQAWQGWLAGWPASRWHLSSAWDPKVLACMLGDAWALCCWAARRQGNAPPEGWAC